MTQATTNRLLTIYYAQKNKPTTNKTGKFFAKQPGKSFRKKWQYSFQYKK